MRAALMAVLVAVSGPVFASPGDTAAPAADLPTAQESAETAKVEEPLEKKICKRIDAANSRLNSKKVCLTAEQWKQRDEADPSW